METKQKAAAVWLASAALEHKVSVFDKLPYVALLRSMDYQRQQSQFVQVWIDVPNLKFEKVNFLCASVEDMGMFFVHNCL